MRDRNTVLNSSVTVTLDGREYLLRYRALAFISYVEAFPDGDLLADMQRMATRMATQRDNGQPLQIGEMLNLISRILWAGLLDAQPDMTLDQVRRMFGFADLAAITEPILKAVKLTMPAEAPPAATENPTIAHDRAGNLELINGRDSGQPSETQAESPQPNSLPSPYATSGI